MNKNERSVMCWLKTLENEVVIEFLPPFVSRQKERNILGLTFSYPHHALGYFIIKQRTK